MLGRREMLMTPVVAWLASEAAEACTWAAPAQEMNESAKAFLEHVFAGDYESALEMVSDNFVYNDASAHGANVMEKIGFRDHFVFNVPALDKSKSWMKVVEKSPFTLTQVEFWKFIDTPENGSTSCRHYFNYHKLLAIYEFSSPPRTATPVLPPPGALEHQAVDMESANTKARLETKPNFSAIQSLIHVRLR